MLHKDHDNLSASADALGELRKIIVQPDEVGEVLPEALARRAERDDALAQATLPIVEENIRQSVQRNPRVLAEAMFPIIGPAIRKAIAEALAQMVQSLNQTLERSLSPQGLKWRIEAMQTGKPFAEVVILNSLVYRVEQVFLIHKKTGILLQHVVASDSVAKDGELVSAMLTAIQDFVRDSFEGAEDATLDTLKVRDFSIWIENSPDAILAAVVRGTAPLTLREIFLEAIERIQIEQDVDLGRFDGDTSPFDDAKPVLQECLQLKLDAKTDEKSGPFTPFNLIAGALIAIVLIGGFFLVRSQWRWNDYVARLNAEPGIVVTEADHGLRRGSIVGLRDELARDPREIAAEFGYEAADVAENWKPYQDASPQFVVRRAEKMLAPPAEGVRLFIEEGVLTADGPRAAEWFAADGRFAEARRLSAGLPGVTGFRVVPERVAEALGRSKISFPCGTTEISGDDAKILDGVAPLVALLADAVPGARLEFRGTADETGTPDENRAISLARAEKARSEILRRAPRAASVRTEVVAFDARPPECAVYFHVALD